jgi:hypothetical protein
MVPKDDDRPVSAQTYPPNPRLDADVAALLAKGSAARFKDFMALRSGFDRWSEMGLSQLRAMTSRTAADAVKQAFPDDAGAEVRALRWYHRGLPSKWAIHKARVDFEVSENALGRRPPKTPPWEG